MIVYKLFFRYFDQGFQLELYSVSPVPKTEEEIEYCDQGAREIYRDWRNKHSGRRDLKLRRLLPWQQDSPLHGVLIAANEAS